MPQFVCCGSVIKTRSILQLSLSKIDVLNIMILFILRLDIILATLAFDWVNLGGLIWWLMGRFLIVSADLKSEGHFPINSTF